MSSPLTNTPVNLKRITKRKRPVALPSPIRRLAEDEEENHEDQQDENDDLIQDQQDEEPAGASILVDDNHVALPANTLRVSHTSIPPPAMLRPSATRLQISQWIERASHPEMVNPHLSFVDLSMRTIIAMRFNTYCFDMNLPRVDILTLPKSDFCVLLKAAFSCVATGSTLPLSLPKEMKLLRLAYDLSNSEIEEKFLLDATRN